MVEWQYVYSGAGITVIMEAFILFKRYCGIVNSGAGAVKWIVTKQTNTLSEEQAGIVNIVVLLIYL